MLILCPACSNAAHPQVLPIEERQGETVCPSCRRRYRLLTRRIEQLESERDGGREHYRFWTVERQGRRWREIIAQPRLALREGMLLTLVWRGRYLVGVADQDRSLFYAVDVPSPAEPRRPLLSWLRLCTALALLLVAVQWAEGLGRLLEHRTAAQLLPGLIVLALVAGLPVLWRGIQIWRGED